jgi:hypothetical protein
LYIVYNILYPNLNILSLKCKPGELFSLGNDYEDWYTAADSSRVVEGQTLRSHSNRFRAPRRGAGMQVLNSVPVVDGMKMNPK